MKKLLLGVFVFLLGSELAFAAAGADESSLKTNNNLLSLITCGASAFRAPEPRVEFEACISYRFDPAGEKNSPWAEYNGPFITDTAKARGLTPRQFISCFLNSVRLPELFKDCLSYANSLALFNALEEGDVEAARDYIELAYLNLQDENEETALHLAVKNDYTEVTSLLLEKGADPLIPNKDGFTASDLLHLKEFEMLSNR